MNLDEFTERSKLVWGSGDYGPTSRQLEPASAGLIESLQVGADHRVLDVAAGHGNAAIAAARRGASVIASDFSPVMVDLGRARSEPLGLDITWKEAQASDLPFEDGSFHRVTSVFGMIFAAQQHRAASEAARVLTAGGMLGLTAWTADGFIAALLRLPAKYGPPRQQDTPDPFRWGEPQYVRETFEPLGCSVDIRSRSLTFRYPSWAVWRHEMESHGMSVIAKQTMTTNDYEALLQDMQRVTAEHDYADREEVAYDADYLEIVVSKPAEMSDTAT